MQTSSRVQKGLLLGSLISLFACASGHPAAGLPSQPIASFDIRIVQESKITLARVPVFLVYKNRAAKALGETDANGQILVPVALLNDPHVLALLACPREPLIDCGGLAGEQLRGIRGGAYIIPVPLQAVY